MLTGVCLGCSNRKDLHLRARDEQTMCLCALSESRTVDLRNREGLGEEGRETNLQREKEMRKRAHLLVSWRFPGSWFLVPQETVLPYTPDLNFLSLVCNKNCFSGHKFHKLSNHSAITILPLSLIIQNLKNSSFKEEPRRFQGVRQWFGPECITPYCPLIC